MANPVAVAWDYVDHIFTPVAVTVSNVLTTITGITFPVSGTGTTRLIQGATATATNGDGDSVEVAGGAGIGTGNGGLAALIGGVGNPPGDAEVAGGAAQTSSGIDGGRVKLVAGAPDGAGVRIPICIEADMAKPNTTQLPAGFVGFYIAVDHLHVSYNNGAAIIDRDLGQLT